MFRLIGPAESWLRGHPQLARLFNRASLAKSGGGHSGPGIDLRGHIIVCGYGRVGRIIAAGLLPREYQFAVIEEDPRVVRQARARGIPTLLGNAANPVVLEQANIKQARILVLAMPDPVAARQTVEYARNTNPDLDIVVRTHSETERDFLQSQGVREAVLGEHELALEMARHVLQRLGVSAREVQIMVQGLRRRL
jgi:CPA2 family monovalent cation:H+ antiporter-2